MIKYRELPADEYERLKDHPFLEGVVPPSESSRIVVAEENGHIIGFQMLIFVPHLEPIWVDPAHRSSWVPFRLWERTKRILDAFRIDTAFCFSKTPEVSGYLTRLGLRKLPYETYIYDPKGIYPKD